MMLLAVKSASSVEKVSSTAGHGTANGFFVDNFSITG
jgi:hypothetical protein